MSCVSSAMTTGGANSMAVVITATSANLAFMARALIAEHIYRCSGLKIQSLNVKKKKT